MTSHARFHLSIPRAVKEQLIEHFDKLAAAGLATENIDRVEAERGVYLLYSSDVLVYMGKASNLRRRLHDHLWKIKGRQNISSSKLTFKCLYVDENWSAFGPEEALIKYFKSDGPDQCRWNGNGFGPHDPGRRRETTNKPAEGFDQHYPIRKDFPCEMIETREWQVLELLLELKRSLPFLLRYELDSGSRAYRAGHVDFRGAKIVVSAKSNAGGRVDALDRESSSSRTGARAMASNGISRPFHSV